MLEALNDARRDVAPITLSDLPRAVDAPRLERAVRELLLALGEDPDREGLVDTPARVARSFQETCRGLREDAAEHLARVFPHERAASDDIVIVRDIEFDSLCEHHLLPFSGVAHVGYVPAGGRVVGLSKLARTVDVFARRPQMQERITSQVADALTEHLKPRGVIVVAEATHGCMRHRGAAKRGSDTCTTAARGVFADDRSFRAEAMQLIFGRRPAPGRPVEA